LNNKPTLPQSTPMPREPVTVALIGAGQRAQSIYRPLFSSLTSWVRIVAVCDPVREHAEKMAAALGVPAFSVSSRGWWKPLALRRREVWCNVVA